MARHRFVTLCLVAVMVVTGLLPAAGLAAPTAAPAAPSQVNVAGSFESEIGGNDWSNNDPLTDMADANADGVWKFTAPIPTAGSYEYKIVENGDWNLAYPANNVPLCHSPWPQASRCAGTTTRPTITWPTA